MRTFGTFFPIPLEFSLDEVMDLGKDWVSGSPYYPFNNQTLSELNFSDSSKTIDGETITFKRFHGEGFSISGMQYVTSPKEGSIWVTDYVATRDDTKQYVSVSVDRHASNASHFDFEPRKPHLVKLITEKMEGGQDGLFKVVSSPRSLDSETLSKIILCNPVSNLPVVYLSQDSCGNTSLNPRRVSSLLSGLAHVFVQKDSKQHKELSERTNGRFPYGGSVGIYWPSKSFTLITSDQVRLDRLMKKVIESKSYEAFPLQLQFRNLSNSIQEEQSKAIMKDLLKKAKDDNDLESWIALAEQYEQENLRLDEENKSLEQEVQSLTLGLSALKSKKFSGQNSSSLGEIYVGEKEDVITEALTISIKNLDPRSRRYQIVKNWIDSHPISDERTTIAEKAKTIFKTMKRMDGPAKRGLEALGFTVEMGGGGHYKISHPEVPDLFKTTPATPSDSRGKLNAASEFAKIFF